MRPVLLLFFVRRIAATVLLIWAALCALLVFFEVLRAADDYPPATALLLAVLKAPRLAMEALPFACAIGCVLTMRRMVAEGELPALRTAGLSPLAIIAFQCAAALPFAAGYVLLSEVLLPSGADIARAVRGETGAAHGLWLADSGNYIRIEKVNNRGTMLSVVIYHTQGSELAGVTRAAWATYDTAAAQWMLYEVTQADGRSGALREARYEVLPWELPLQPSSLSAFTRQPRDMALRAAMTAAAELAAAGQHSNSLQKTIWQRWLTLPAVLLLVAFGVGFVGGDRRNKYAVSLPVLTAVLAAGGYFIARDFAIQSAGVSASILPLLLPPMVLGGVVAYQVWSLNSHKFH